MQEWDFYKDNYNKIFWHSSAHILASALKKIMEIILN